MLFCVGVVDGVPELPLKVVLFALQHRGPVHDVFMLLQFATLLATSGSIEKALVLFSTLLRLESERPVQIAIIKRCLLYCWARPNHGSGQSSPDQRGSLSESCGVFASSVLVSTVDPDGEVSLPDGSNVPGKKATIALSDGCLHSLYWDVDAVARFVLEQQGLSPATFLHILRGLGVPRSELLNLCSMLLSLVADGQGGCKQLKASAALDVIPYMTELLAESLRIELTAKQSMGNETAAVTPHDKSLMISVGTGQPPWRQLRRAQKLALAATLLGAILPCRIGKLVLAAPMLWIITCQR
jgi:hypothetical protein